jgi:hypothetical protein
MRQGLEVARAMEFRKLGTRIPMRRPVQCRSSISWCIQLHESFPRRQDMVGSNEAHRHREQEARPDQARGRWRWNIEEPASGADDQAKHESDDGGSHNTALPRTRNNRNRHPITGADARYANAIG